MTRIFVGLFVAAILYDQLKNYAFIVGHLHSAVASSGAPSYVCGYNSWPSKFILEEGDAFLLTLLPSLFSSQ